MSFTAACILLLVAPQDDFKESALQRDFDTAISQATEEADQEALKLAQEALEICFLEFTQARVNLKYRDPAGKSKTLKGTFLRRFGKRIQVKTGRSSDFAEIADIAPDSLSKAFGGWLKRQKIRDRDKTEGEKLAWLMIFSGDAKLAGRALGKEKSRIPDAWWAYAEELGEKIKESNPEKDAAKREIDARELFYDALRESQSKDTLESSVAKMRQLEDEYGDLPFVINQPGAVAGRGSLAGSMTLIPADLVNKAEGLWKMKRVEGGMLPKVWSADRDSTSQNYAGSPLEASFYVKKDEGVSIYIRAFVCCKITAELLYQGTEMKIKPQGKDETEIGMDDSTSGRINAPSGLETSCSHGRTKHKWMWIRIANMSYASDGVKDVRIMTENGEIAVSHVLVLGSSRKVPGSDADFRKLMSDW